MRYPAARWDALNLRIGATHAWNDINISHCVNAGGLARQDKAGYEAKATQVFGDLGCAVKAGGFTVEPFVGVARVELDSDGVMARRKVERSTGHLPKPPNGWPAFSDITASDGERNPIQPQ